MTEAESSRLKSQIIKSCKKFSSGGKSIFPTYIKCIKCRSRLLIPSCRPDVWRLGQWRSERGRPQCDTAEGQDQAQDQGLATLLPYYYSHYSQPRPRRWATGHTPPQPPVIMTWSHQTSDDSFTRPRARPVSSAEPGPCPGPFRSEEWGLVRLHCSQSQPGAGPGPGADYRVQVRDRPGPEHNTATDTCHYTGPGPGEHSDSRDQPPKDERFCWIQ